MKIDQYINKIICGDTLQIMREMPDNSIDLVVTSPPYNLKNSTGNGMKDGRGGKLKNALCQSQFKQNIVNNNNEFFH